MLTPSEKADLQFRYFENAILRLSDAISRKAEKKMQDQDEPASRTRKRHS